MTDDARVTCATCANLRNGWCTQAKRARVGINERIEIGRTLAELPQHCPAHVPRARAFETPTETAA